MQRHEEIMKICLLLIVSNWAVLVLSNCDQCEDQCDQFDGDGYGGRNDGDTYSNDRGDGDSYTNDNGDGDGYGDNHDCGDSDKKKDQYDCDDNIEEDIYTAISTFAVNLYKLNSKYYRDMFILSPNGIYLELAAMAEGATGDAQKELFRVLGLPENNMALRQKYYARIRSSIPETSKCPANGTYFATQILAIDESFCVNETWAEYARSNGLLDYVLSLPLKCNPNAAIATLNNITYNLFGQDINLDNNSLIDTVNQTIVFRTEFPSSKIEENATFYNEMRQPIGTVTLMHARNRFMIAPLEKYKSRALVLPMGEDGRYAMIYFLNYCDPLEQTVFELDTTILKEILYNATETKVPIDIAVPKFTVESSNMSMKCILEELGVKKLWYDPDGSNLVSDPPAIPRALYQRVRFNVDSRGVFPYCGDDSSEGADGCEESADNFIVNRPFLYGVVDTLTKFSITAGAYTCPV